MPTNSNNYNVRDFEENSTSLNMTNFGEASTSKKYDCFKKSKSVETESNDKFTDNSYQSNDVEQTLGNEFNRNLHLSGKKEKEVLNEKPEETKQIFTLTLKKNSQKSPIHDQLQAFLSSLDERLLEKEENQSSESNKIRRSQSFKFLNDEKYLTNEYEGSNWKIEYSTSVIDND